MADIKKILIFSGVTLAVIGGGIFAYKVLNDKKIADDKAAKAAQLAKLKAKLSSPTSTPSEKSDATDAIKALLLQKASGIGIGLLDKLLGKISPKKGGATKTPKVKGSTKPKGGTSY